MVGHLWSNRREVHETNRVGPVPYEVFFIFYFLNILIRYFALGLREHSDKVIKILFTNLPLLNYRMKVLAVLLFHSNLYSVFQFHHVELKVSLHLHVHNQLRLRTLVKPIDVAQLWVQRWFLLELVCLCRAFHELKLVYNKSTLHLLSTVWVTLIQCFCGGSHSAAVHRKWE